MPFPGGKSFRKRVSIVKSMKTLKISILSDNTAIEPFLAEHGLSLALETEEVRILLDTGNGETFFPNLQKWKLDLASYQSLVLSHGHYDHTGALAELLLRAPHLQVYHGKGVEEKRFSCHPGLPAKEISMPEPCKKMLLKHSRRKEILSPRDMGNGFFLTGRIPRVTPEDTGGPFFTDEEKKNPDPIMDEMALLWEGGVLLQGCCHAGIGNTLSYCREKFPSIAIHTVAGGLHLKDAEPVRLESTLLYLKESGIKRLVLFHCTGQKAMEYLKKNLPGAEILTPGAGESFSFTDTGERC